MDGFAGFPIRASLPRGAALVEFTRGARVEQTPPRPSTPTPAAASERQESLAIRRGAERVVPERPIQPPAGDLGSEGDDPIRFASSAGDRLNTEGDVLVRPTRDEQQGGNEA